MQNRMAILAAIGLICISCFGCGTENQDQADPTIQSNNSRSSDNEIDTGTQEQTTAGNLSTEWEATKARVKAAIESLDKRTNDDAFVVIEDLITGRAVQFQGGSGEPLSLFFPLNELRDDEVSRAASYFADFEFSEIDSAGVQAYIIHLEHDHEKAAIVAIDVFMKIYQLSSNFDMHFAEH